VLFHFSPKASHAPRRYSYDRADSAGNCTTNHGGFKNKISKAAFDQGQPLSDARGQAFIVSHDDEGGAVGDLATPKSWWMIRPEFG